MNQAAGLAFGFGLRAAGGGSRLASSSCEVTVEEMPLVGTSSPAVQTNALSINLRNSSFPQFL